MIDKSKAYALRMSGLSFPQIAKIFHVSPQRIQQILCPDPQTRDAVKKHSNNHCERCGIYVLHGHVHHKAQGDEFARYNNIANLQYLCISCHRHVHPGGENSPRKQTKRVVYMQLRQMIRDKKKLQPAGTKLITIHNVTIEEVESILRAACAKGL